MNDDRLDQLIHTSLEWQAERAARRAPSLANSVRAVAERLGPQPPVLAPVVVARPGSGRSLHLILAVILLALLAAAAAIVIGSWRQESTLPTGPTGSLAVARGSGHAAVALPDGRVLVVGGWQGHRPVGSAELWDPVSGMFSATGSLEEARNHASATLLHDGRVLVAGGFAGQYEYPSNAVALAELWDPADGSFSATGSLAVARAGHSAILLADGRVVVTGNGPTEVWDPATGEFSQVGPAMGGEGPAMGRRVIPLADGRILIIEGPSARVWEPGSGRTSDAGPLVEARTTSSATLLPDGRVLVVGGRAYPASGELGTIGEDGRFQVVADRGSPSRLASAELWDPATGQFTPTGSMTRGRIGHTATLLPDGRVLILGGEGVVDVVGNRGYRDFPGAELWDPATGDFSPAPMLAQPRADHSAILLAHGRVLVVGGQGPEAADTFLTSVEIYDPNRSVRPTPAP
jgi:hypothetical protein